MDHHVQVIHQNLVLGIGFAPGFCKEMKELKNQNLELQLGALNDLGVLHDIEYKPENFGYIDGYIKIIDLAHVTFNCELHRKIFFSTYRFWIML